MIPAISSVFDSIVQWWQRRLAALVPSVPKELPEAVVSPQIRNWFRPWLANSRNVDVSEIKDRGRITAKEALQAMADFKVHFDREMSNDRFNGHWGVITVHEFLEHAQHCHSSRRSSRTDTRRSA